MKTLSGDVPNQRLERDPLNPASLLPFSMDIGENPYGHAIEAFTFNEPYQG